MSVFTFNHFKCILLFLSCLKNFCWKSADSLLRIPLYVIFGFSLAALNIFPICLIFATLISICLVIFFFGFILFQTLWPLLVICFPILKMFLTIIASNIYSYPFFFLSSSRTPIIWMFMCSILQEISEAFFNYFPYFFFILLLSSYFYHSIFNIYLFFIDYAKAFNCVDHNKLGKILKEIGILDHLTCLLRNLYAG